MGSDLMSKLSFAFSIDIYNVIGVVIVILTKMTCLFD